ncbi:hypothetical protein DFO67_108192 [Modicisalibacter xianhensis]|uniref:Helix-hairpin-helix domain-containing protein n=1 Tax=Modicisalibacter xianhensis TaxID=442341 RepID=A0A4V3GU25_9GAMM|nr:hypothetical protein [Halomonas xianhensis]TDX29148.1 hypothetical protein DFO67_108192 [Halomonas xianhensis]
MNAAQQHIDDPLSFAIAQQLKNQDLQEALAQAERRAKVAEQRARQADKLQQEASQQRERADRLRGKLEAATKEAKQAKHEARQVAQQAEAAQARTAREREAVAGMHMTLKSDDEQMVIQLAYNQVHVHEPDRWYMISSMPLDRAPKHRLIFCGLIDGVKAGKYGKFAIEAAHRLAREWRKEHGCLRVEDLDLPSNVVTRLEDAGFEMAREISHKEVPEELVKIKGIGPAALKKVAKALRKEGLV